MKLRYTPEALCDLQEIKRYIKSELHNPTAANRITKAILDGCGQLKQFPKMGVSIGAKTGYETDLRMLVVESYIALYRIETETVSVGRIINARQDYIRILFGEVTPPAKEPGDPPQGSISRLFLSDRADGGQNFLCKGDH